MQATSKHDAPRNWKRLVPRARGSRGAPVDQNSHSRPVEEERGERSNVCQDEHVEEIINHQPSGPQDESPPEDSMPTFSSSKSSNSRPRPSRATNKETLKIFFGRRLNRFSSPRTSSSSSRPPSYVRPLVTYIGSSNADSGQSNDGFGQANDDSGPADPSSGPYNTQPEPSTSTFDSGRCHFEINAPCNIFTAPTVFNQDTAKPGPSSQFAPSPQPSEAPPPLRTYTYQPLKSPNHIRFLRLASTGPSSTQSNQIISAFLCEFDMDAESSSIPAYKALSHEWGQAPKDESDLPMMLLNGRTVQIRQNLHDALTCLTQAKYGGEVISTSGLWLWVDALCINQDDLEEKGHQVGLMKRIFKGADTVLVWLGMGDNRTVRAAMKTMNMEEGRFERAVSRQTLTDDKLKASRLSANCRIGGGCGLCRKSCWRETMW